MSYSVQLVSREEQDCIMQCLLDKGHKERRMVGSGQGKHERHKYFM